jgi:hypothetical protein
MNRMCLRYNWASPHLWLMHNPPYLWFRHNGAPPYLWLRHTSPHLWLKRNGASPQFWLRHKSVPPHLWLKHKSASTQFWLRHKCVPPRLWLRHNGAPPHFLSSSGSFEHCNSRAMDRTIWSKSCSLQSLTFRTCDYYYRMGLSWFARHLIFSNQSSYHCSVGQYLCQCFNWY